MKLEQLLNSLWIASSVSILIASPARAQAVQVTGVQLNPTANGLEIILETPTVEGGVIDLWID